MLVLAVRLWAKAGWATGLVTAVVQHRADAAVRTVQEAVRGALPNSGATADVPAPAEPKD